MAKNVSLSHTFGGLSGTIPLSYLDDDFTNLTAAFGNFNAFSNYLVDTGATNAYAATLGAGLTGTIAAGLQVQLKISNTNTAASTFAFNGGLAANILNSDGTAMSAGQLLSGGIYNLLSDGTHYILIGLGMLAGTFTGTLTGVTATVTRTIVYTKIGNVVNLSYPDFAATSNTTAKTITGMPIVIRPTTTQGFACQCVDNATGAMSYGFIASSGVMTFQPNATTSTWTNSGGCGMNAMTITYNCA